MVIDEDEEGQKKLVYFCDLWCILFEIRLSEKWISAAKSDSI